MAYPYSSSAAGRKDTVAAPGKLWKRIPPERRLEACVSFWQEEEAVEQQAEALLAIASHFRFRAKSVRALPLEKKARYLASLPGVPDSVAGRVLVAYHLAHQRPMLAAFLDALGMPHDNGVLNGGGAEGAAGRPPEGRGGRRCARRSRPPTWTCTSRRCSVRIPRPGAAWPSSWAAATRSSPMSEAPQPPSGRPARRGPEAPDISEKGGLKGGQPQRIDDRLFMQLLAFGGCADSSPLGPHLAAAGVTGVVYEDLHDPRGVAVLALSEDPAFFLDVVRPALERRAVRRARAEAGSQVVRPDLRVGIRAGPGGGPLPPADAHGAQSRVAVGRVVPASAQRPLRAVAARRAAGDSRRARRHRHGVRRRRPRPRHPPGLPRPRRRRQRLRRRPGGEVPASPVGGRARR